MNNLSIKRLVAVTLSLVLVGGYSSMINRSNFITDSSIEISDAARTKKTINVSLKAGEKGVLDAGVKIVKWKNKNHAIASVDNSGNVVGIRQGTAIIIGTTANNETYTFKIKVSGKHTSAKSLYIDGKQTLKIGEITSYKVSKLSDDAQISEEKWTSSNTDIISVDNTGKVEAHAAGTATITCTVGNDSAQIEITVVDSDISTCSIEINGSSSVKVGSNSSYKAVFTPENTENKDVIWSSSNPSVATIDENGQLKALKAGTTKIVCTYASDTSIKAVKTVTITSNIVPVAKISISGPEKVYLGVNTQYTASVEPNNATTKGVRWSSSNTAIATIDSNGNLKGIKAGTVTITCTSVSDSSISATKTITVTNQMVNVTSIKLNGSGSLSVGEKAQIGVTVSPSNATNKAVTWISSNDSVVSVNSNGTVMGKKSGTAVITCQSVANPTVKASISITVSETKPTKVVISNSISSLKIGKTLSLKADVSPTNTADKSVKWSSSDTSVLTVNSNGTIKAEGKGTATITCRSVADPSISDSIKITVKADDVADVEFDNAKIYGDSCYITLKSSTKNVKNYTVQLKKSGGDYITLSTSNPDSTTLISGDYNIGKQYFEKKNSFLKPNTKYVVKVTANSIDGVTKKSETYAFTTKRATMYKLSGGSYVYDANKKQKIKFSSTAYFTGLQEDSTWVKINFADFTGGKFVNTTGYVKKSEAGRVNGVTSNPTYQIGQITALGNYKGNNACGPCALSVAISSEKNKHIWPDNLQTQYGYKSQEELRSAAAKYGYVLNKGRMNSQKSIKEKIDAGHNVIVVVRYPGGGNGNYNTSASSTHFITIMGYEGEYFYVSDSAWGPGAQVSNSLVKVNANTVIASMNSYIVDGQWLS